MTKKLLILSVVLLFTGGGLARAQDEEPKPETKPRTLVLEAEGGAKAEITVPAGVTVHSSADEPLDWNFAIVDDKANIETGVRIDPLKPEDAKKTEEAWQKAYLANVHELYDPKVEMKKDSELALADGKKVSGYVYTSEYWKTRLVVIIPGAKTVTTFEVNAQTPEELKVQDKAIAELIGSWKEK